MNHTYSLFSSNEELRAVGVWTSVGHTDRIRFILFQRREFIWEFFAPDTFPTCTVA